MATKKLNCRTHGGIFEVVSKPGRPPVRCTEENPCSRVTHTAQAPSSVSTSSREIKPKPVYSHDDLLGFTAKQLRKLAHAQGYSSITRIESHAGLVRAILGQQQKEASQAGSKAERLATLKTVKDTTGKVVGIQGPRLPISRVERAASTIKNERAAARTGAVVSRTNVCIPLAHKAKAQLEELNWIVKGRAWDNADTTDSRYDTDADYDTYAEITADRGDELLIMRWKNGALEHQHYTLWNTDRPSANDKPASRLNFDPDELSDGEIARRISGMKIVWWNKLGNSEETAIVPSSFKIEHHFNGLGDETPADRVVSFIDRAGSGFRAFRLGALIKVG